MARHRASGGAATTVDRALGPATDGVERLVARPSIAVPRRSRLGACGAVAGGDDCSSRVIDTLYCTVLGPGPTLGLANSPLLRHPRIRWARERCARLRGSWLRPQRGHAEARSVRDHRLTVTRHALDRASALAVVAGLRAGAPVSDMPLWCRTRSGGDAGLRGSRHAHTAGPAALRGGWQRRRHGHEAARHRPRLQPLAARCTTRGPCTEVGFEGADDVDEDGGGEGGCRALQTPQHRTVHRYSRQCVGSHGQGRRDRQCRLRCRSVDRRQHGGACGW